MHGTIYYVAGHGDVYRVVTTVDSGSDSTPVRFEAVLADGQSIELLTPLVVGQPALTVLLHQTVSQVDEFKNSASVVN